MIRTQPSALIDARTLVQPHLQRAVADLHPELRRMTEYHFGWVDETGRPIEGGGGKGVRPALVILAAEAVGGRPEDGIPGAVAIELIHNFALIHDDIMDGDHERRHRRTVWSLFGVGNAIVVGDALMVLAHEVLLESETPRRVPASELLAHATAEMISGQASDLAYSARLDVSLEDATLMASQKTASLLECATSIGAVLGGAAERRVGALGGYGRHLGVAFQAVDDILGIWGRPETTGKPCGADLRERKMSLPVVAALDRGGAPAARLKALLGNGTPGDAEVAEATVLIEQSGGREWTATQARQRCHLALQALASVPLEPDPRRHLEALADFITDRDF